MSRKTLIVILILGVAIVGSFGRLRHRHIVATFGFESRLKSSEPADQLIILALQATRRIPERKADEWNKPDKASALAAIAVSLTHMGNQDAAAEALRSRQVIARGENVPYMDMACFLASQGRYDQAKTLDRMRPNYRSPDPAVYLEIVYRQASHGDFTAAKATAESFPRNQQSERLWRGWDAIRRRLGE